MNRLEDAIRFLLYNFPFGSFSRMKGKSARKGQRFLLSENQGGWQVVVLMADDLEHGMFS